MMTNVLIQFMHTTAAYQAAVAQLLIGEANFVARELELDNWRPIATTNDATVHVGPPPRGVEASIENGEWTMLFQRGWLVSVMRDTKRSGKGKNWPTREELAAFPSRVGTNEAGVLLMERLGRLGVDTNLMRETGALRVSQIRTQLTLPDGGKREAQVPEFILIWRGTNKTSQLRSGMTAALRGDTLQWTHISLPPAQYHSRPKLVVTDAAELLGEPPPPRFFVEQLYGGMEKFSALTEPDRVEIELMEVPEDPPFNTSEVRVGPVAASKPRARMLSAILADFDTYMWAAHKLCIPRYGVRLRFIKGATSVEVLLCFECDELLIDGTHKENFDFGHNRLLGVVRSIFPSDAALKGIEPQMQSREDFILSVTESLKRHEQEQ